jgi:CRP-like cAMP-binding protein
MNYQTTLFPMPFVHSSATCLSSAEMEWLELNSHLVEFKKGDVVIKESTPSTHAVCIQRGLVKITKQGTNGKPNILEIKNSGQYIGLMSLLSNTPNEYTIICVTDSVAQYIDLKAFKHLMSINSAFSSKVIADTCQKAMETINRLVTINNKHLPGRVADVILYFYELNSNKLSFEVPLSRAELAQFSGTTKESFIRTLTEFKNDRLVTLEGKIIHINSLELLNTLSKMG